MTHIGQSPRKPARSALPPATSALVQEALSFLSPDVDRDTWVKVGMAVKASGLADAEQLWCDWSARSDAYSERDTRATWRSLKESGRVKVGTLFGMAQDKGFRFPATEAPPAVPDQAALEREAEARRQRAAAQEAEYRSRADQAARDARRMWADAAPPEADALHAYLARKAIGAHGVRVDAGGQLLVPMVDADGELQNLQRIAPVRPADGNDKRYLPGARKSGLMHIIGQLQGAPRALLGEGYATCATVHEATGWPAVVAFDAGNLKHVAQTLREQWPELLLVVCADDDHETEARTGKNPGRQAGAAAVKAAGSHAVLAWPQWPAGQAEGRSDFNDLAAVAGQAAVKAQLEAAAAAVQPALASSRPGVQAPAPAAEEAGQNPRQFFEVNDEGVWYHQEDKRPQWLCAPLHVQARTRTDDGNGWGWLLTFTDPDGTPKTWAMPDALLLGDGAEWVARLGDMGLRMAYGPSARGLIRRYVGTRRPDARVTCVERVGWHAGSFVLPSTCIGAGDSADYVFQSESGMEDNFRRRGMLADWQRRISALAAGNSRLVFALSTAFAAPCLRLAEMESGGLHFRGDSSQGKTTLLRVAASVYGPPAYMQRWRATENALEGVAVQHCDALLVLDEIGQLDPRVAGEVAYLLANETEKSRSTRGSLLRRRRTWRLLFLSSGEKSLASLMLEAGKKIQAGMEVRMVDVPAVPRTAGYGIFEDIHGFDTGLQLVEAFNEATARSYGTAGRAWLQWLCDHFKELPARLKTEIERHRAALVPEAASHQVQRVGSRFALVAAAGEMATEAGITGWTAGHATWAARQCFNDWLAARGHVDSSEHAAALRQVRAFLEKDGDLKFSWAHRTADDRKPATAMRAGIKRLVNDAGEPLRYTAAEDYIAAAGGTDERRVAQTEYLVFQEAFKNEVCGGLGDYRRVAELLRSRGHLVCESDRLTRKHRIDGMGEARVFHIKSSIFVDDFGGID